MRCLSQIHYCSFHLLFLWIGGIIPQKNRQPLKKLTIFYDESFLLFHDQQSKQTVGVLVGDGIFVGVVGAGEPGVGVRVRVAVGMIGVGVRVLVGGTVLVAGSVAVRVRVTVGLNVLLGVNVLDGVRVIVGDNVRVGVRVGVRVRVGVGVKLFTLPVSTQLPQPGKLKVKVTV